MIASNWCRRDAFSYRGKNVVVADTKHRQQSSEEVKLTLDTTANRGRRVALAAAAAGAAAALALFVAAEHPGSAHAMPGMQSTKATAFSASMDKLWEEHIVWTRMVIVDFAGNLPDLKTAEARLLRNQTDIGNAIKPYYGAAAGSALTQLLRRHILGAVPVLQAAKSGDKPASI